MSVKVPNRAPVGRPLSDQTIGTLYLLVTITLPKNEESYPTTFHGKFGNSPGPNLPESPPMVLL